MDLKTHVMKLFFAMLHQQLLTGIKEEMSFTFHYCIILSEKYFFHRIENRSMFLSVYFRQVDGFNDSWQFLLPNSSVSFCWEDLGRQRLLEFLPDDIERSKSEKYNIDDVMDHKPNQLASGPMKNIFVSIVKEGKMKICRISDWIPEFEHFSSHILKCSSSSLDSELQIIFELADLGLSIIDRTPEEILYLSVQNPLLSYSTGLASGISR